MNLGYILGCITLSIVAGYLGWGVARLCRARLRVRSVAAIVLAFLPAVVTVEPFNAIATGSAFLAALFFAWRGGLFRGA